MIRWALFSTLASGLFYGLYLWLLRRDGWLQLSRVYLILTLAFSLAYPLVRLPEVAWPTGKAASAFTVDLPALAVATPEAGEVQAGNAPAGTVWLAVYLTGVAVLTAVLLVQVLAQAARMRRLPSERQGGLRLSLTDDDRPPYSFFNRIVVGTRNLTEEELRCILAHEAVHVRERHTMDVLLMRTMCCLAWFNPFAWLMLRELRAVHEYQADGATLRSCDRADYMRLLFRQATGIGYGHITNNFQSINIKKRIVMMNKTKTRYGAWKLLAVLPVAAALLLMGSKPAEAAATPDGHSRTLMTVNYHKAGGKKLPFIGLGYNQCQSKLDLVDGIRWEGTVTCQGEGWATSHHNWELSDFKTSKGRTDGRVLTRYEKKLLKTVDKELLTGGSRSGTLSRSTRVKAEDGMVNLVFTATWRNGNRQGDADITLLVAEAGNTETAAPTVVVPDQTPEFPGGQEALYKYLAENLHYPEQAKANKVQGKVYVSFTVKADGSIANAKVERGIGGGCDEEALRVVKAMPKWKPGTDGGRPVDVQYHLPIIFSLQ